MVTVHDAPADALIDALADKLTEYDAIEEPEWAQYTKTGAGKELSPTQDDFWEKRTASLLRKVAIDGPVGVERLSTEYGDTKSGSNRYRVAPEHKSDAGKKIIRTALQQLEEEGLVEIGEGEGRFITPEGQSLLDTTAGEVIDDLDRSDLERYV
ncbi:MAG: 30S ribosomal protein S19e [Halobacteriaceae archaeon]